MRKLLLIIGLLMVSSPAFAAGADSIQVDCSAFRRVGPASFVVLKDTNVIVANLSQNSRVGFDRRMTLNPGDVVIGHNERRYDIFDLVRGQCTAHRG